MKRAFLFVLVSLPSVLVAACSSGGDAPSAAVSSCTQSGSVWTCGGYGELPQCPAGPGTTATCDYDGGACFQCAQGAGEACGCARSDAATLVWSCMGIGASCQP